MLYVGNPEDPMNSKVQVSCFVAFYAIKRAMESPTALLVSGSDSPYEEICRIELGRAPLAVSAGSWGQGLTYTGTITFPQRYVLLQAIKRTHGGKLPEMGPVFVEVRVALPTGTALAEHAKSRVQFGLLFGDPPRFIVKIDNWSNGVSEAWRSPAFMDLIR
jgi:hypothetical protein